MNIVENFWNIFWPIFWIIVLVGISGLFFYLIKILREISIVLRTASNVSEQIQSIADLIEDVRTKAGMGVFVDVLELSKRFFQHFRKKETK